MWSEVAKLLASGNGFGTPSVDGTRGLIGVEGAAGTGQAYVYFFPDVDFGGVGNGIDNYPTAYN